MNRKYHASIKMIVLALALSSQSLVLAASPPPVSSCVSALSLFNPQQPLQQPSLQSCQSNGPIISQCILFNMASQIPSSSESISDQLNDANNAAQVLAKLDFQCQFVLSCGSQQPACASDQSATRGGLGSSIKNILGIKSSPPASSNSAAKDQADQTNVIQPAPLTNNKNSTNSESKDNQSNSINWF